MDDQARCQTFNIKEGVYQNVSNQFYWRRVIATGSETLEDGKVYYYVDLSAADCLQGSTVPQAGDQLVQMGNRTDTDRQGFISIEVSGDLAPAFKVYRGVNSYTLDGKRKICISPKLTEIRANKFIEETSYGVFVQPRQRDEEWYYGMQCYYYDLVQYDGATWLCIYPESGIGGVMYTTDMPSEDSPYWRIYARKGKDGSDGKSFNILGSYDTEAELIAAHPTGEIGDAYIVAGYLYVWDAVNNRWHNSGQIKGDPGRGIRSAKISYGIGTATDLPSEWKDSVSELSIQPGDYLYVRTILYYTDGTQSDPSYSISRFGLDGAYKATAFCRTNKDISAQQLSGGTMSNAVPNPFQYQGETITFTDGIPAGEAVVWAASNVFYGDGTQAGWTYARRMSDTATFDVEFSPNETKPAEPSDDVSQREAQGWYDPTRNPSHDFTNSIWRAERHCKNGVWSAWAIEKIKGEKGDSVAYDEEHSSIGYAYSSMGTPEAGRDYPSDIASWSPTPPAVQKGKYLWTKDVTAYDNAGTIVYTTTYGVQYQPNDGDSVEIDSSRTFIKYCRQTKSQYTGQHPADSEFSLDYPTNLGQGDYLWILNQVAYVDVTDALKSYSVSMLGTDGSKGDKGADGYTTHFAYATSADGSQNFSTTNFVGATYIGTYRDDKAEDSDDYHDYVWTEWKGEKGDSVSYDEEHSSIGYAYSSKGTPEAGRDYPSDITSWSPTPPAVQKGKYLWTKDVTAYDNAGTIVYTTTYGVQYQPNDGDSVEIDSSRTFIKYCRQTKSQYTGQHPADSEFSLDYPTNLGQGDYLWILNQVAYVDVTDALKSYSVSMLGTDGSKGDKGADGYTTHFAYATSADGSQNFSTTNFVGATYIGTYRDDKAEDSDDYHDYVWTEWKGEDGTSAATCFLDKSVVFVKVDTDGYVIDDFEEFVHFSIYHGIGIIAAKSAQVNEDGHQQYVELTGGKVTDMTGTTITVNNHTAIIHSGASVSGHKVTLTGNYVTSPNALRIRVQRGTLIDEHVATLQVIAEDADGNEYLCIAPMSIQREVIAKDGQNGADGKDGQPGAPGDDAVNVMLTPENVILEQNEDDESVIDLTKAYTVVSVNKGGTPDNNFTLSIIGREHCQATVDNNTKRVTITQIDTYNEDPDDPSSDSIYYDNGYVDVRITYGGQNYDKRFGFYANLLGTWKRTVVGDAEAEAAKKVAYIYDPKNPNQVVKMETFGNYVRSSTENSAKLERDTTEAVENIANTAFEDIEGTQVALSAGEYIVQLKVNTEDLPTGKYVFDFAGFHYEGGEQFIEQRITVATSGRYTITLHDEAQSGAGLATMLYIGRVFNVASEITQTADRISTTVKNISPSKNLLKGSLSAKGWMSSPSDVVASGVPYTSAKLDDDGYIVTNGNDQYLAQQLTLSGGKTYTLSFYSKKTTAITVTVWVVDYPTMKQTFTVAATGASNRKTALISVSSYLGGNMGISINTTNIKQPQLEEGSTATDFIADSAEISSGITQTVDSIKLAITEGLEETGIDIERGAIELKANKTTFATSAGVPMIAVQMCDANGNVGTGSQYTIPSIVFYNGRIGAQGVSVQWVLNYLGFIQATNAGVRYSFVTQYNIYSFLPIDEEEPKVGHVGVDVSETLSPNELARECFYNDFNVETMNLFNCGYYINDGGTKIYQPTQGKNYEMYNNIDAIRRYWLTDAVNNVFVPDDNNNNTASGYYFVPRHHEIENYYSGRWPDSDDWQNYRNTISLNNDPVRVVEAAKVFDLVYFEPWPKTGNVKDQMTPTNVAGIMRVWKNAFVVFYTGTENGLQKTCIGAIGGNKDSNNNPVFYPGVHSIPCTPQKIIKEYNI